LNNNFINQMSSNNINKQTNSPLNSKNTPTNASKKLNQSKKTLVKSIEKPKEQEKIVETK
jgi:hypothetical protein